MCTSLCVCWIYYQQQGTFWHLLIGPWCWDFVGWKSNCNLTLEMTVLQYQLYMLCNVKPHYAWPICRVWQITARTTVCTFYLDTLCLNTLLYQQFVFNMSNSIALNLELKAVSMASLDSSMTSLLSHRTKMHWDLYTTPREMLVCQHLNWTNSNCSFLILAQQHRRQMFFLVYIRLFLSQIYK